MQQRVFFCFLFLLFLFVACSTYYMIGARCIIQKRKVPDSSISMPRRARIFTKFYSNVYRVIRDTGIQPNEASHHHAYAHYTS